jgi:hypothetical protein
MCKLRRRWIKEDRMLSILHPPTYIHITPVSIKELRPSIERCLLAAAVVVVAVALLLSGIHTVSSWFAPTPGTIKVIVHPGENLWTYATKYGNPHTYILKRVHNIALMNHIQPGRPLQVGQQLVVPLERPIISAKRNSCEL